VFQKLAQQVFGTPHQINEFSKDFFAKRSA
jgi:hypothetical protein